MNMIQRAVVGVVLVFILGLLGSLYYEYIVEPKNKIQTLELAYIELSKDIESNQTMIQIQSDELNVSKTEIGYYLVEKKLKLELEKELKDIENENEVNSTIGKHTITI